MKLRDNINQCIQMSTMYSLLADVATGCVVKIRDTVHVRVSGLSPLLTIIFVVLINIYRVAIRPIHPSWTDK